MPAYHSIFRLFAQHPWILQPWLNLFLCAFYAIFYTYSFWIYLVFWSHSCFSRLVNCGAATMENDFQVTILDSEALKILKFD